MESPKLPEIPVLSVTVLNYNYAHYLPACLDSILSQTMRDFEVLLINDCSTDDSLDVIKPYLADSRVKLIHHEVNRGYVSSLLEGCARSCGRYLTVISADDYALSPQAFEIATQTMEADQDIVVHYSAWHQVDDDGHIEHTRRATDCDRVSDGVDELRRLLLDSPVLHSGTIIRRSAYDTVGGYDSRCRYSVDTNMWLALCSAGKIAYANRSLYAYRAHSSNLSNTDGAFWRATEEMLWGIDDALKRFPDAVLPDKAKLRRRAYQRALVAVPTLDIFANRIRRGWHGYWLALQHYPVLTACQVRTVALALRTLLGAKGYDRLRDAIRGRRGGRRGSHEQAEAYNHA